MMSWLMQYGGIHPSCLPSSPPGIGRRGSEGKKERTEKIKRKMAERKESRPGFFVSL